MDQREGTREQNWTGRKGEQAAKPNPLRMMRKLPVLLLVLGAVAMAAPVGAGPSTGGIASNNVEHVKLVPFDAGTAQGAAVIGKHLYVMSYRAISIYDVADPVNPQLLSTTPIGFAEQNEDIATDGKILLFSEFGESSHWFDEHPRFDDGGLLALAWYSDGTRLVRVSKTGEMKEIGYFVPHGGITTASYWINDRIIYSIDHNRGIHILRYTGDL